MSASLLRLSPFVLALTVAACKDPPPPSPANTTTSTPSPSTSVQQLPDTCEVTIIPGEKVTTKDGEEAIEPGKALGIAVENGKTYCIDDKKLTPQTTLAEARPMLPPDCTVEDRLGASHLLCRAMGLRLTFAGPPQKFSYFDLFAKNTDPFPAAPATSTSASASAAASATPMAPGCDATIVPGARLQFATGAQELSAAPGGGPINAEPMPGKSYCVFGGKVTSKTHYTDLQKMAPKTCKLVTVKGGWHLVCSIEGVRFSFGSADGMLFRFSLFAGGPGAGMP